VSALAIARGTARVLRAMFMAGLSDVTIDFTRAQRIEALGLAVLAGELAANSARSVTITGLGRHDERLLRYLGARVSVPAVPEDDSRSAAGA
jgi:hypothetical protein